MAAVSTYMKEKAQRAESALWEYLGSWAGAPARLQEAVAYSLFAGGKRLRPVLVLGASEIVSGSDEAAMPLACAVEMIHTYSLIHDDLPAMDDDDLRRGRPTCHVKYGEAMAILAGDALLTMAFDMAARPGRTDLVAELARSAGVAGMVGGQVIDLESEGRSIVLEDLRHLHALKTGALIRASVRLGAMAARAENEQLAALTAYGEHIGLAFQIADDMLDVVGSEEALGKPIGSDIANEKSTYPALVGLDRSRELAREAATAAVKALQPFGPEAAPFRALADFIVERES